MSIDEDIKDEPKKEETKEYLMPERLPDYFIEDENGNWLFYSIGDEKFPYLDDENNITYNW